MFPRTLRTVRRHLRKGVTAALAAAVVAAVAAPAATADGGGDSSRATGPHAPFRLLTSERMLDSPGLDQFGATDVATVYDQFHFSCTDTGCVSNGGANPMPTEDQYRAVVRAYVNEFHAAPDAPVLLDFEGIVLSSLKGKAADNALSLWKTLIRWTHRELPKAPVGLYSWDWLTANLDLTKELHGPGLLDFFAPDAYIYASTNWDTWAQNVAKAAANDRSIVPNQPIYSFVSPEAGPSTSGKNLSAEQVRRMFDVIKANDQGLIMWETAPAKDATACGWLATFAAEAAADLGRPLQTGPLTSTATAPDGTCAAVPGTVTPFDVTVVNTSGTRTAATVLQMPYALPNGVSGTWSDANVPALEPGESFRTTLRLTVAAGHVVSSAPLHLTTGLGDTLTAIALG